MCLYIRRLMAVLGVFVLCSCSTVSLPPRTATPRSVETVASLVPSPVSPIATQDASHDGRNTVLAAMPSPTRPTAALRCATYIETRWGAGPGEFGLCPASSPVWWHGPFSPVVNGRGELFVFDKVNRRILRYTGNAAPQAIPVPSSYAPDDVCSYSFWNDATVSENRLFLHFSAWKGGRIVDQLAVLSLEGHEQRVVDLELYGLHSHIGPLVTDTRGGVYLLLPPAGVVHFDNDLRPEFRALSCSDPMIYHNLAVGWDGNLYTYDERRDLLNNWGKGNRYFMLEQSLDWMADVILSTRIVSPTGTSLIGADTQGRLYFKTHEGGTGWLLVRVSASGDQRTILMLPDELAPALSTLAPDGSLYGLVYNYTDPAPSVKPKIVKCVIDQDQTLPLIP